MPAQMTVEKSIARIGGEPGGQIGARRLRFAALVADMGEPVRAMRVVRVQRHRPLDLRPGRRELSILGQRHRVIGQEPVIVAVMRGEAVHQLGDLVLLPDPAGAADQAVRVRGNGNHQRIARPRRQMRVHGGDRGVGLAREDKVEKRDMAGLPLGQAGGHFLGRRQGRPRRRDIAFPHQHLGLAGMGQGKTGVGGDGAVIGLDRAGVEGQRQLATPRHRRPARRRTRWTRQGRIDLPASRTPAAVPEIDIGRRGR